MYISNSKYLASSRFQAFWSALRIKYFKPAVDCGPKPFIIHGNLTFI